MLADKKQTIGGVDKRSTVHLPMYLRDKRDELIWSLSVQQEYNAEMIRRMFNLKHLSTVTRIIARRPKSWRSPWVKQK